MRFKFTYIFLMFCGILFSQEQKQIDSVKALIPRLDSDTARIRNYLVLAEWIADLDEWSDYNNKALELINKGYDHVEDQKLKDRLKLFKANALNNKGLYYREKGEYSQALKTYDESLRLQRELKNIEGEAVCLVNISAIEISNGNASAGINKNLEALKIFRDVLHDKIKTATVLSNIGHEYMGQGDIKQAIDFYNQALELQKEMKNDNGQALVYTNFGNLYFGVDEYQLSQEYYKKAAEIYIRTGDRRRTAKVYTNMSSNINIMEKKPSYKYDSLALEIFSKLDDQEGISRCYHAIGVRLKKYGNVGLGKTLIIRALNIRLKLGETIDRQISALHLSDAYIKTNQLDSALYWAKQAENMANTTGYNSLKKDAALTMSNVYAAKKDFETALDHYKKYKSFCDSTYNDESRNAIHKQLSKMEMDKRETELRTEQEKRDIIVQAELKRQQTLRNAFLLGFAAVSVLLFFVFKNYREKKKANSEIIAQKYLVEEKQKEILDSIHYAKRIQNSLLPNEKIIEKQLNDLTRKG
jgi:tetratricopeptide (TPR) repeat protein